MRKLTALSILGLSLAGLGVYRYRREIVAGALRLRPPRYDVAVNHDLRVPMPDGVALAADHYFPRSRGSFPTILIRTPYGRGTSVGGSGLLSVFVAQRFAERGFHVVVQDVRGRFGSGGGFEPFVYEASDGRATLEWISRRAWFNGSLGMWGQSYVGYVQWAAAPGAPPFLKALVPSITGSQIPTIGIRDRALGMDTLFRWIYELESMNQGGDSTLALLNLFNPLTEKRILGNAFQVLPLAQADQALVGKPVPFYQKWLAHPELEDPYWQAIDHGAHLAKVQAAVHQVGGWYDFLLRETLADYARLRQAGHTPYLTIGPWMHLSLECAWESLRQGLDWFDSVLRGDHRFVRKLPVRIYIMGSGVWREMRSWPPPSKKTLLFLAEDRRLSYERPGADEAPDRYIYDPADPTPAVGGPMMNLQGGPRDNRSLEARPDVLTYTTPPLQKEVEVIGPVTLVLHAKSSQEYTDFFGRLCDVAPNGRSTNVCDGLLRVEPAVGRLQPDGTLCLEISLWATAYLFQRGHRMRLQVSSGAFPRFSRNLGTGEPQLTATHMVTASQTIYHDAAHPSALVLPVTSGSF
jgi:putative CocE/NonD family hydrolase